MKKNLWIGILGGAALGAAAGYYLANRGGNLGKGLKNMADSALDNLGGMIEEEAEEHITGTRHRRGNPTSRRG